MSHNLFKKLPMYVAVLGLSCSEWDLVPWPETLGPQHWERGVLLAPGPPGRFQES